MQSPAEKLEVRVATHAEAWQWVSACAHEAKENFSVMSRFVPRAIRPEFAAVYAFCRVSDDLAGETGSSDADRAHSLDLLKQWRSMLAGAQDVNPPAHPIMLALGDLLRKGVITKQPLTDLIAAFENDQTVARWPTLDSLLEYSTKSANPVGRLVLNLFGVRFSGANVSKHSQELAQASDAVCTALQLTNFWQDVRRDLYERDRIYVPCAQLELDPTLLSAWIRGGPNARHAQRYSALIKPLHEATQRLFDKGQTLLELAPPESTKVLALCIAGGEATLARVRAANGYELWKRPRIGKGAKSLLMVRVVAPRPIGKLVGRLFGRLLGMQVGQRARQTAQGGVHG